MMSAALNATVSAGDLKGPSSPAGAAARRPADADRSRRVDPGRLRRGSGGRDGLRDSGSRAGFQRLELFLEQTLPEPDSFWTSAGPADGPLGSEGIRTVGILCDFPSPAIRKNSRRRRLPANRPPIAPGPFWRDMAQPCRPHGRLRFGWRPRSWMVRPASGMQFHPKKSGTR